MATGAIRDQRGLGKQNRSAVLETLVLRGPLSRKEIADRLGLTSASISRIVRPLLDCGLVRELEDTDQADFVGRMGRPSIPLDLMPEGGYVLGADLSLSFQSVMLADLKNRPVSTIKLNFDERDAPDAVIDQVTRACQRLIDEFLEDRRRLLGGFVAVAGAVNEHGSVTRSRYLGWRDVPLASTLSDNLSLPIKVESSATSLTLAESRFGAVTGQDNTLIALCGIRLAIGMSVNGQVIRGRRYQAGLVGSVPLLAEDGSVISADRSASGLGVLLRIYEDADDVLDANIGRQVAMLSNIIARDRDGDPAVAPALAETGRAVGRAVAYCALLTAPESLVIGGILAAAPSFLAAAMDSARSTMGEDGPIDIHPSAFLTPDGYESVSASLAICEYLFDRSIDLAAFGASEA